MKKLLISLIVMGFTLLTLNGCGTIAGVGKDLQRAGQAVEGEAQKH
jgi:predicted small secreted protein